MEIHDELDTPGCPQCAVKHLCAALSYAVDRNGGDEQMGAEFVLAARALVNLAEADIGYESHRDFAIGLLERAEREALLTAYNALGFAEAARRLRVAVISGDAVAEMDARQGLHAMLHPSSYMWAHLVEARRELPSAQLQTGDPSVPAIQAAIARVREEYFDSAEAAVAEEDNKEGGPEMATKKAKCTTKCADKGGKTAKPACKGKKCK